MADEERAPEHPTQSEAEAAEPEMDTDTSSGGIGLFGQLLTEARSSGGVARSRDKSQHGGSNAKNAVEENLVLQKEYEPRTALATEVVAPNGAM